MVGKFQFAWLLLNANPVCVIFKLDKKVLWVVKIS